MAENGGGGSAGVVAVLVIFVIVVLAGLFLFGGRIFKDNTPKNVNVTIGTPSKYSNALPGNCRSNQAL